MIFNSIQFLIFLPLITAIYYIIPKKIRYIWLLLISYYFYMCWNPKYVILIIVSTLITFWGGLGIQLCRNNYPQHKNICKAIVIICFSCNLGILIFFKYFDWILSNINHLFHLEIVPSFSFILPVGISFYTFQALGYIIDIYRGEINAEKNIFRYALFISFFPQLVAGPIERSKNLLTQLRTVDNSKINFMEIRNGLCLILYGFFLKLVIADRVAILVDTVFGYYTEYGFLELVIAAFLFSLQILCDFNGYSIIAKGSAQLLGIKLMDNFYQPYLASSIKEFWRRWHISLTSWFTEYLYIPLGGSKKGTFRQIVNTLVVFCVSGLWHGASWHYVAWGIIHGLYQIIEIGIDKLKRTFNIQSGKMIFSSRIARMSFVFILTSIAWIFFRADSCKHAFLFFGQMFTSLQRVSLLDLGLSWYDWLILAVSITTMLVVDILHEKGIKIREWLYGEKIWFRWLIYLTAFGSILLFGIYGADYDTSQFIYFQF